MACQVQLDLLLMQLDAPLTLLKVRRPGTRPAKARRGRAPGPAAAWWLQPSVGPINLKTMHDDVGTNCCNLQLLALSTMQQQHHLLTNLQPPPHVHHHAPEPPEPSFSTHTTCMHQMQPERQQRWRWCMHDSLTRCRVRGHQNVWPINALVVQHRPVLE